jgi:hypothetical protein
MTYKFAKTVSCAGDIPLLYKKEIFDTEIKGRSTYNSLKKEDEHPLSSKTQTWVGVVTSNSLANWAKPNSPYPYYKVIYLLIS